MLARSKAQSGASRLFWGKAESRVKESTMIQTLGQESVPLPASRSQAAKKEFNISVTESIVFPEAEKGRATVELSRSKPMTLREQIIRKQRVLWS
jgi:hypothetical protein